MSGLLPGLAVLAVGGSIAPPLILLTILFLGSRRPLSNAGALALGYFAVCAVVGILGLTLLGSVGSTAYAVGRVTSAMVGGLLVVVGIRSLLMVPDAEASPPGWMESTNTVAPARAFGIGMALFPIQVKNLAIFVACLNLIAAARLEPRGGLAALGLVLLIFAIPVLALIGLYAAAPNRASGVLGSLRAWMERNSRAITVVLCFVFGTLFLIGTIWGL